jgi:hypothetical protein
VVGPQPPWRSDCSNVSVIGHRKWKVLILRKLSRISPLLRLCETQIFITRAPVIIYTVSSTSPLDRILNMAEPLSVSASVAGLLGLTGQLLSGCLYLKDFYNDAKNSPKEILSLATELDALSDVVQDTSNCLNGLPQGSIIANYEPTIKQCLEVIHDMKAELNVYSTKLGGAKRSRWWTKVEYASKKKAFSSQLSRLQRVKTQVIMVSNNIFE